MPADRLRGFPQASFMLTETLPSPPLLGPGSPAAGAEL